jgi:hypothetical protein
MVGHRAIVPRNTDRCSIAALSRITFAAEVTVAASHVDLAHHTLANPVDITSDDLANELMAEDSPKIHIAPDQLKVSITDPSASHT